jgi:hypothetical protein
MGKQKKWIDTEKDFLKANYQDLNAKEIGKEVSANIQQVYLMAKKLGLEKKPRHKGRPYIAIRNKKETWMLVVNGRRKELHVVKWEQVNGKLPKGHVLRCKDGNSLNSEVSNWQLITKAQHMKLNSNHVKSGKTIKKLWDKVKLREAYGRPVYFCSYTSRKKKTVTRVINHQPIST